MSPPYPKEWVVRGTDLLWHLRWCSGPIAEGLQGSNWVRAKIAWDSERGKDQSDCAACGHGCIHTALWQRGCSLVQQIITYKQDVLFFHLLQCFFVGPWAVWAGHRLKVRICPTMWISAGEYCCQTPLLPKSEILIKQQENEPDTWWQLNCIGDHSNEGSVIFPS